MLLIPDGSLTFSFPLCFSQSFRSGSSPTFRCEFVLLFKCVKLRRRRLRQQGDGAVNRRESWLGSLVAGAERAALPAAHHRSTFQNHPADGDGAAKAAGGRSLMSAVHLPPRPKGQNHFLGRWPLALTYGRGSVGVPALLKTAFQLGYFPRFTLANAASRWELLHALCCWRSEHVLVDGDILRGTKRSRPLPAAAFRNYVLCSTSVWSGIGSWP